MLRGGRNQAQELTGEKRGDWGCRPVDGGPEATGVDAQEGVAWTTARRRQEEGKLEECSEAGGWPARGTA